MKVKHSPRACIPNIQGVIGIRLPRDWSQSVGLISDIVRNCGYARYFVERETLVSRRVLYKQIDGWVLAGSRAVIGVCSCSR